MNVKDPPISGYRKLVIDFVESWGLEKELRSCYVEKSSIFPLAYETMHD